MEGSQDGENEEDLIEGFGLAGNESVLADLKDCTENHGGHDWLEGPKGCVKVHIVQPCNCVQVTQDDHSRKARQDKPQPGHNPTPPPADKAPKEHANLGSFGTGEHLVDCIDAVESGDGDPTTLLDEFGFEERDLGYGASPGVEAEAKEEEGENLEEGEVLGEVGRVFEFV